MINDPNTIGALRIAVKRYLKNEIDNSLIKPELEEFLKTTEPQPEPTNDGVAQQLRAFQLLSVQALLRAWGIESNIEYPGYLQIAAPLFHNWAVGPAPEQGPDFWTGELSDEAGLIIATIKFEASNPTDAVRQLYLETQRKNEQEIK